MAKTIVLIHGAWVTKGCWEKFIPYFEQHGFTCIAPAWPYKDGPVDAQRAHPDPRLAHLGTKEIVDHYAAIIAALPEPPILIGHSFGGLFVQMLLSRGLGAAGIAIDPAPPKGVLPLEPSVSWALRIAFTVPFAWRKVLHWPFSHFQYAFVHTMPPDEQRAAYDAHVVPETGRIFWQSLLSPFNDAVTVDYAKPDRAPLLIIAGGADRTVPASLNRRNLKLYAASPKPVDFKEFPGRPHWLIASPGWEEIAAYCAEWIGKR